MNTHHLSLSGKTALVTGGSRGIGREIVRLLADRGATVAFTYGKSKDVADALAEEVGGHAVRADAGDPAAAKKGVEQAADKLGGRIDILVNNAGVFELGPIDGFSDDQFNSQVDVNVKGVWFTTQAAAPLLNEGGRVVNLGSVVGERVPFPGASAYGMTKHAVSGFTKGWARDFAPRKITVNVVEPGPIDTDMNPDHPDNEAAAGMKSLVPLGRYGHAWEVAELVAFLASPAAAYISGAHVTIDGGMIA